MRTTALLIALLAMLMTSSTAAASETQAAQAVSCQFVLGFKTLADLLSTPLVGNCKENEHHNAANGDGLQQTSGGLLVWRKADNWTAFTDGYQTWINGPYGLQDRLNTELFPWEAPSTELITTAAAATSSRRGPIPAVPSVVAMTRLDDARYYQSVRTRRTGQ